MSTDPTPAAHHTADFRKQYRLIHDIYVLLDDGDRRVLENFGLTTSQYAVLTQIEDDGGRRLTTLSERLLLSKSTITRIVDQLEKAGLVQRVGDAHDRRAQRVILTEAGRERRAQARAAHLDSLKHRLSVLSEGEQKELEALLRKLRTGLQELLKAQQVG